MVSGWIGAEMEFSFKREFETDGIACLPAIRVGGMALRTSDDRDSGRALHSLSHDS
jgi:hypothetical protein